MPIAQTVADIIKPIIRDAVEQAIQSSLIKIQADMHKKDNRIEEAEQRINTIEEEIMEGHALSTKPDTTIQMLMKKIDDLENRLRRNNLRIVSIPETVKPADLNRLCEETIPQAMGINKTIIVERAHRIGAPQNDTKGPRQIIARYLNFSDKNTIPQNFQTKRELIIERHNILLFSDYSAEVSKKRKIFSKICTILYQKKFKFTLAYPATLHMVAPDGKQYSLQAILITRCRGHCSLT